MKIGGVLLGALASVAVLCSQARAQEYPNRPVTLVVGVSAGSGPDVIARLFAEKLGGVLRQSVVVENQPGAGELIAVSSVARSEPDGYRLLWVTTTLTLGPAISAAATHKLSDFAPISMITQSPFVQVAHPSLGVGSVDELAAHARRNPRKVTYGFASLGGRMLGEMLKDATKTEISMVPFRGGADAITALVGGQISFTTTNVPTAKSLSEAGKVRVLGVHGTSKPAALPGVQSYSESADPAIRELSQFSGFAVSWYGLLAPANTPDAIIRKLGQAAAQIAATREFAEKAAALNGAEPVGSPPEEFVALLAREFEEWPQIAKRFGIVPQ